MGNTNLLNIALGIEKQAINAQTVEGLANGAKGLWNGAKKVVNYAFRGEKARPNVGPGYDHITNAEQAKNLRETANLNAAHNAANINSLNQVAKGRAYNDEIVGNAYERLRAAQAKQQALIPQIDNSIRSTTNYRRYSDLPPDIKASYGLFWVPDSPFPGSYGEWADAMARQIASGRPGPIARRVVNNAVYPKYRDATEPYEPLNALFGSAQGNRMVANINQGVINQANRDLAQATVKPQKYLLPGEQAQLRTAQQARQQAAGDWVAGKQLERYFQGQPTPLQKKLGEILRIGTGVGVGAGAGYYFGNRSK